jgi:hypothetical protein
MAIGELIERQIAYSDFAVDEAALECLRFKRSVERILSGDTLVGQHPHLDWSRQVEHVYADSISVAANALVSGENERVLRFDEFVDVVERDGFARFEPFHELLSEFRIAFKPILWLRLIAYGNACNRFVIRSGAPLGFEQLTFPVADLIQKSKDEYIVQRTGEYERMILEHSLVML